MIPHTSAYRGSTCLASLLRIFTQVRGRRRTLVPPKWQPPTHEKITKFLREEDRDLLNTLLKNEREPTQPPWAPERILPGVEVPDATANKYSFENSKRVGLIAKKIGMTPQWATDGTRMLCTMLHVQENHVISAIDPDSWYRKNVEGKRNAFNIYSPMWQVVVGAINDDSIFYTDAYRRMFEKINVPTKQRLGSFSVSEDAVVKPGTPLDVRHFQVGQYVTVSGKTIDWGFQGGMHRWGMKGMPARGTTKSHRRIGSIGSKGDARVWPGKRMPGHMGYEWKRTSGLQIIRINPIKQVIYVLGCVPGDLEEIVHIQDSMKEEKRVKDPPFPTYFPNLEQPLHPDANSGFITSHDIYAPHVFRFHQPSIVFTQADETKSKSRDKTRAKTAKVKK